MTAYRVETKTRTVEREVRSPVTREVEVPYTWYETVPVTTPEKRNVTVLRNGDARGAVHLPGLRPGRHAGEAQGDDVQDGDARSAVHLQVSVPVVHPREADGDDLDLRDRAGPLPGGGLPAGDVHRVDPCTGCCHTVCCKTTEMQTVMKPVSARSRSRKK